MRFSPGTVLRNLTRQLGKVGRARSAVESGWPYRRSAAASKILHRPIVMNLPTSDGSGQACHPDVLWIPDGFGSQTWRYWMVCTPYPFGDSSFENPELFVSFDGVNWTPPSRAGNPIVPTPQPKGSHNSDPDLLLHEGELWLFYRETIRSPQRNMPDTQTIYCTKSRDGESWSTPSEVLSDSTGAQLLSPAVICKGNIFFMWTVEMSDGALRICRRRSENGQDWQCPEVASLAGLASDRHPWHIDVLPEKDRLSAVLVSCTAPGGVGSRIHYAYSQDSGLTWSAHGFLFDQSYEFESKIQYRGSLCKPLANSEAYELWYSASSHSGIFSIAYLRLTRDNDTLVPYHPASVNKPFTAVD